MRGSAVLIAGMNGLACCVVSLIDARGQSLAGREKAALPHVMRGWARTPPKPLWWPEGK